MTLPKHAVSYQIAGYAQGRQGRRPIRVDTLLEKEQPKTYATHDGKPIPEDHPLFVGYIKRPGNVMYPIFDRNKTRPYDPKHSDTRKVVKQMVGRMREMDDGGKEYLNWRLKGAPGEIKRMFQEEMQKKGSAALPLHGRLGLRILAALEG